MAREKKLIPVDKIVDRMTGETIVISYNPNKNWHEASFNGETYHDLDKNVVVQRINDAIMLATNLNWLPIIQVSRQPYIPADAKVHFGHAVVDLRLERFYVALTSKGEWRRVDWNIKEEHRFARQTRFSMWGTDIKLGPETTFPIHYQGHSRDHANDWLPFDETLWANLNAMVMMLHSANERIQELCSTDQGLGTLMLPTSQQLFLPAASK